MRLASLVLAAALAGACGREPASEPRALEWIELELVDASEQPPEEVPIARFGAEELEAWDFQGGEVTVEPVPLGPHVFVSGAESKTVSVPGRFSTADLSRLTAVIKPVRFTVSVVDVLADDGSVLASATHKLRPTVGPTVERIDLPSLAHGPEQTVTLRLRFSEESAFRLYEVQLQHVPQPLLFGPEYLEAYEPFLQAGQLRTARFFWQPSGLRAELAPVPGQRLAFSFALPDEIRPWVREPVLTVTLSAEGREPERHAFPLGGSGESSWRSFAVPLEGWEGEPTTATWTLEAGEGDVAGMLTRPRLELPMQDAPTVLLVTSDTHRADCVGAAKGGVEIRTDTLDTLARDGVFFDDVLASINNTAPSHVALLTGTSPRDTGVVQNGEGISSDPLTLADCFRNAGYVTIGSVSAPPVTHSFSGLAQGFECYSEPRAGERPSSETLAFVREQLSEYDGLPVFAWVHVFDAHSPYTPPAEYERMYYPKERDPFDASAPGAAPELAPEWSPRIADPLFTEALYKSEISHLDSLLADLFAHPRLRGAIVAFTGDHGETLARGTYHFDHRGLSPATLAVPLIVRAPGLPPGTRIGRPARQIDIGRTLLNLAGLQDVEFPGLDLFGPPDAAAGDRPRFALEANARGAAVRAGRWMLHLVLNEELHRVELFDVVADPYLERDVSAEHRETTAQLRQLLVDWLLAASTDPWARSARADAGEVESELAALGYVTVERDVSSNRWIEPDCPCAACAEFR